MSIRPNVMDFKIFKNLTCLDISKTNLRTIPDAIGDLPKLTHFDISENKDFSDKEEAKKLFVNRDKFKALKYLYASPSNWLKEYVEKIEAAHENQNLKVIFAPRVKR